MIDSFLSAKLGPFAGVNIWIYQPCGLSQEKESAPTM
jgi:hypothetical protein